MIFHKRGFDGGRWCYGSSFCGGTLVKDMRGNQWVVTAAHCVNIRGNFIDPETLNIKIIAGSVYRTPNLNKKEVAITLDEKHIIFHPDWLGDGNPHDCNKNCIDTCSQYCPKCGKSYWSGKIFIAGLFLHASNLCIIILLYLPKHFVQLCNNQFIFRLGSS